MGKRIISIFIFLCILLGITSTALADSESPSIEQVYLNMPDVTIYSYGIDQDKNIEGFLDGEKEHRRRCSVLCFIGHIRFYS